MACSLPHFMRYLNKNSVAFQQHFSLIFLISIFVFQCDSFLFIFLYHLCYFHLSLSSFSRHSFCCFICYHVCSFHYLSFFGRAYHFSICHYPLFVFCVCLYIFIIFFLYVQAYMFIFHHVIKHTSPFQAHYKFILGLF